MKPLAIIHVDVDSLWAIADHFDEGKRKPDHAMYTEAAINFSKLLKKYRLPATFFCIGRDAKYAEPAAIMRELVAQGHEVANHTMSHSLKFDRLSSDEKRREIIEADQVLCEAIQSKVIGFRSPGYFNDDVINQTLLGLGYQYETSKLPSPFLPLMKFALKMLSGGFRSDKRFGRIKDSWGKKEPYALSESLLEIPISVIPLLRFPFHSTFVFLLGKWLFWLGLNLTRVFKLPLVYLFHGVDLLPSTDDVAAKKHLPLRIDFKSRYKTVDYILKTISRHFNVVTTESFVKKYQQKENLKGRVVCQVK